MLAGELKMAKIFSAALLFLGMLPSIVWAENLSGIYRLSPQGVLLTLTLKQDPQADVKGTLSSTTGAQFQMEGIVKDGVGLRVCKSNEGDPFSQLIRRGPASLCPDVRRLGGGWQTNRPGYMEGSGKCL